MKCSHPDCIRGLGLVSYRRGCSARAAAVHGNVAMPSRSSDRSGCDKNGAQRPIDSGNYRPRESKVASNSGRLKPLARLFHARTRQS